MNDLLALLSLEREIPPFEYIEINKSSGAESSFSYSNIYSFLEHINLLGMGGAGFPTRKKLESFKQSDNNILVINGVECEPGVMADKALLLYESEYVKKGAELVAKELNIKKIYIAVKEKHLNKYSTIYSNYLPLGMSNSYPSGAERLIFEKIIKSYPTVKLRPTASSVLINNVATLWQIGRAISNNAWVNMRPLTLIVPSLNVYKNLMVPANILIQDILKSFSISFTNSSQTIITGGVMMGKRKTPADVIDLTVNSVFIINNELFEEREERDCISCGACYTACPLKLQPAFMHRAIKSGGVTFESRIMVEECFACGACSMACPSDIKLSELFLAVKKSGF